MIELNEVRIKRIYEPEDDADGARRLVDRIWPSGISKDAARLASWLRDIAPSAELRQWFDHDLQRWTPFKEKYFGELRSERHVVGTLIGYVRTSPVMLLYGAHD